MSLLTYPYSMSFSTLRERVLYTSVRVASHPLAKKHQPTYDGLLADCDKSVAKQLALSDELLLASIKCDQADETLDDLLERIDDVLLDVCDKERKHLIYKRYFGLRPRSDVARPTLGKQLEYMAGWDASLQTHGSPALDQLGKELTGVMAAGHAADEGYRETSRKLLDLRSGGKQALVDRVNQVNRATWGDLAAQVGTKAGAHLPKNFADRFFPHQSKAEVTVDSLTARLEELAAEQQTVTAQRDRMRAELAVAAAAEKAKEQAEAKAQLAALSEQAAELAKKRAELEKKLGQS